MVKSDARATALLDHLLAPADTIRLDYDARLVRRKRLVCASGRAVLLDLPKLTDLSNHAGLRLDDGTEVALEAAEEAVLIVRGNLPRLAWHIGNRHAPCKIGADALVIRDDHVLRAMLEGLGADVVAEWQPFHPERGAYGLGRTMGHDHGSGDGQDHAHHHDHRHDR